MWVILEWPGAWILNYKIQAPGHSRITHIKSKYRLETLLVKSTVDLKSILFSTQPCQSNPVLLIITRTSTGSVRVLCHNQLTHMHWTKYRTFIRRVLTKSLTLYWFIIICLALDELQYLLLLQSVQRTWSKYCIVVVSALVIIIIVPFSLFLSFDSI